MTCVLWRPIAWAQPDAGGGEAAEAAGPRQQFQQLPVNADLRKNYYTTVNPMLMAGRFTPGQESAFDEYYHQYFLSRWTDPKNVANLPAFRKELRTSHLGKKSSGAQVHDHLNALVLKFMKDLIDKPFHPAVQVNAMLMIGELNGVEQPPTPLPEALPVLIAAVGNTDLPDAVRAAAMVGIQRHVAPPGITDPDARRTLTTALHDVADADLPTGVRRAGRQWILGQALELLAGLGAVGNGNAVFKTMLKAVGDGQLSLSTRSIAAESLGRLNYSSPTGIDPTEAATALGRFVIDVCAEELAKAKDSGKPIPRRRIQQCLGAVETALEGDGETDHKGIASLAKAPNQKTLIEGLQKNIQDASGQLGGRSDGDDLTDVVEKLQSELEALLK